MRRRLTIALCTCLCGILAACSPPQAAPTRPPAPTVAPSPEMTSPAPTTPPLAPSPTQPLAPSPTAAPTTGAAEAPLPAAVYLIEAQTGQVTSLEADGVTLTQITFEAEPVRALTVSAAGGIAYVIGTGDAATLVSLDGSGRRELATGRISYPRLSPDGRQIMYRLDDPPPGLIIGADTSPSGVWVQSTSGMRPSILRADDAELNTWDPQQPAWTYVPVGWSPAGDRAALFAYDAAGPAIPGGDLVIIDPAGIQAEVRGPSCCEAERWSADGRSLTMTGGGPGPDIRYGLYRVDAATGAETALLEVNDATIPLATGAQQLADGAIYAFVELVPGPTVDWEYPFRPAMARVAEDGAVTPLRPADLRPYEAIWAADGSGALIVFDPDFTAGDTYAGPLAWLAAGVTEPLRLPISGTSVHWAAAPLTAGDCGLFAPLGFQEATTRSFAANVRDLQARLNAQGFAAGPADGFFGEQTRTALEAFQAAQGLPATGALDCASWQVLLGT